MTPATEDRRGGIGPPLFAAAFLGAVYGLPLVRIAKNRLVVGEPVYALDGLGALPGFGPEIEAVAGLVLLEDMLLDFGCTVVGPAARL
ncbi:hypothetical protein FV223_23110, partial [Methylobacterium sp. WL116]